MIHHEWYEQRLKSHMKRYSDLEIEKIIRQSHENQISIERALYSQQSWKIQKIRIINPAILSLMKVFNLI